MTKKSDIKFGLFRSYLWPVHSFEHKKIIPLILMIFFAAFIFNMLRISKDALLVTAPQSGAEVIPFVKLWVLLPMAILFTFLFTRFSNRMPHHKVFMMLVSIFLLFFVFFTFVVYPFRDHIHPHRTADFLQNALPKGLHGFVAVFRYWSFSINYAMSELWGNIIVSVVFWGFANEITRVGEAKRFYALLGLSANVATILAGYASKFFSKFTMYFSLGNVQDPWRVTMILTNLSIFVAGVIFLLVYRWMYVRGLARSHDAEENKKVEKPKLSVRKSFAHLMKSRYLLYITFTVIGYNLVINLVEVLWKDQVKQLYPINIDFQAYMGGVTVYMGVMATIIAIFVGAVIRRFGWTFAALLTPITLFATSIVFFFLYFAKPHIGDLTVAFLSVSPLYLVVFAGTVQNCLSRSAKYTVFEVTKEIAFTPLSRESRVKGKACIDGVTSRFGKASSSVIYQILLIFFLSLPACAPYIAGLVLLIVTTWIFVTKSLGKQFTELTTSRLNVPVKEEASTSAASK